MRLALVAFLGLNITLTASTRSEAEEVEKHSEQLEGCSADNCPSFADEKCPCKKFDAPALMPRMLSILTDTVQRMRKVSDKLDEDSGTFTKMWWSSSVGDAQKDMKLLEAGVEHLPELQNIMTAKPVNQITSDEYQVPASVHPISVEIWDDNTVMRQKFIGEVGVDLVEGEQGYSNVPLQLNTHQTSAYVQPGSATVTFSTSVEKSAPKDCNIQGVTRCVEIRLRVTCISALDLPNTDTGIAGDVTDAYCKVRVKPDTQTPSRKFKTPVVPNNLNPTFSHEPFELTWDVPILEPVPTSQKADTRDLPESEMVPFTSEYSTIGEQLEHQLMFLASKVYLTPDGKCKSSRVKMACGMMVKFANIGIDDAAVEELRAAADDNDGAEYTAEQPVAAGESLAQVSEYMDVDLNTQIIVVRAAAISGARRGRARRGGGGYHGGGGGGGGGGCGGCWVIFLMCLLLLMLL